MPIDVEMLRQIPLFALLSAEELAHVASMTAERHYERGDLILLEGERGGALHYVRRGLVKVFKTSVGGKEQVLRLIAAGHTFNDVPALDLFDRLPEWHAHHRITSRCLVVLR